MAAEEQAPVDFDDKRKDTEFIGSSMTKKGKIPKGVMPTMTMEKIQKKQKLRNAEYFDLQESLDWLYAQSKENHRFTNLMELVTAEENILLAYRNISKNKGSKTAGTDRKTKSWPPCGPGKSVCPLSSRIWHS